MGMKLIGIELWIDKASGGPTKVIDNSGAWTGAAITSAGIMFQQANFEPVAEVTDATNAGYMQAVLRWPEAVTVKSLYVSKATKDPLASPGQTTIKASSAPYSTTPRPGDDLTTILVYNLGYSTSIASGAISLAAGAPLYVFLTEAGGHQNIQANIGVELT